MLVVDADAHVNEPVVRTSPPAEELVHWQELTKRHPGWHQVGRSGGHMVNLVDAKLYPTQEGRGRGVPVDSAIKPAAAEGAAHLGYRLRDLDSEGIDIQVLYGGLSLGVATFTDAGFAEDFCVAYNNWLHDTCASTGGRLRAAAVVPLQDTRRAVRELERARGTDAVAVAIPPVLGELNLDTPELRDFFEAVSGLGVALAVHSAPGMNIPLPAADRFDNYAQVHCLSFPVDQMVALTALAMGGVLDSFPGLRVVFLESGVGWVPYYLDRMAEHRAKRQDLLPGMTSHPRDYLERGQCFFSFECEEPMLSAYIEHLGFESLVFSTDYPHWDCEFPGAVAQFLTATSSLPTEMVNAIAGGNAMRLYGIEPRTQ